MERGEEGGEEKRGRGGEGREFVLCPRKKKKSRRLWSIGRIACKA